MTYVLTLNANTASPVNLTVQRIGKAAPTFIGSKSQSYAGSERSSIRGIRRNWQTVVSYVDDTTRATIEDICSHGSQLPCSGDIFSGIQTQCSVDVVSVNMVVGTSLFEIALGLSEVQPNCALIKYAAGDVITGSTFTRSTTAYYTNDSNNLQSAAIDTKRDAHYIGVTRHLLLEAAGTNVALWCRDLTNAAWTKTNMTTAKTSLGADAIAASATRLTATAGNATATQAVVLGSSARFMSAYVKRITGTGTIQMTTDGGALWTTIVTTAAYTRLTIPTQTLANPNFGFRIVTSGDAIDVDFVQNETGAFATSPIATTTVAVTRGADLLSLPFTPAPQEMTVYAKFTESGTIATANARLWEVSNAAAAVAQAFCYAPAGFYTAAHHNGTALVVSAQAAAPVSGNTVEVMSRLFGDGSVDGVQSISAAASTSSAQSGTDTLATAWSDILVWLNSSGSTNIGYVAIQNFKILAGTRSLSEMRAA